MSSEKPEKEVPQEEIIIIHKLRITLTGKDVPNLEQVCKEIKERAVSKKIHTKGPVRMPTRILRVDPRKASSGQGKKTYDHYEMRIHKRLIDLYATTEQVKQTVVGIPAGIDVEVSYQ